MNPRYMKNNRFISKALRATATPILLAVAVASICSCEKDYQTYEGPNYILFSDTMHVFPVQNSEDYFNIPISATRSCDYDRTLAVEIVDKKSNAIEGFHYELESNTVTIKAGQLATNVRVKGRHDNIEVGDSLCFSLRLVTEEDTQWDLYGIDTRIQLQKACTFDINTFTGYALISFSTYFMSYMPSTAMRLIEVEKDEKEENTIIMKDYFYDGYDVKLRLESEDILNPIVRMDEQIFAETGEAFGTIYGDGYIHMYEPSGYVSYYSSCEKFIFHYMTLYVPNVGTVGTYINAIEFVSDDEAEKLKREGY